MTLLFLGLYLALMAGIGIACCRRETTQEYLLAGRRLGPVLLSFSFVATYFSTSSLLGGGGSGYLFGFGWSAFLAFFHVLFAVLTWTVVAPRMRRYVEEEGILTVCQFFGRRYGSRALQMTAALVIAVFFQLYLVSIYKGAANLLQTTLGLSYPSAVVLAALPVVLYTAAGGFRSVVLTDLVQGVILLAGGILLFALVLFKAGGLFHGLESLASLTLAGGVSGKALMTLGGTGPKPVMEAGKMIPFLLSLTFAISVAQLASPQLVIRFFAARDEGVIRKGILLNPLLVGIFALCVFSVGPFAHLFVSGIKDPDLVIPTLMKTLLPPWASAFLLVAAVAAAMSTISSVLMVVASSVVQDLAGSSSVGKTRLAVLVLGCVAPVLALNPPGIIVTIVGLSFSVIASVFTVPLLAGLYLEKPSRTGALAAMILSAITCVGWQMFFFRSTWIYPVVPGLCAALAAYGTVHAAERLPLFRKAAFMDEE